MLTKAGIKAIGTHVDKLFGHLKSVYLGTKIDNLGGFDKRLAIGHRRDLSLPGLYESSARDDGAVPSEDTYENLRSLAEGYIDAQHERTKAQVIKEVSAFLADAKAKGVVTDLKTVLGGKLADVFGKVTADVNKIIDTEAQNGRAMGTLEGITKINALSGIDDPTVYFVICRDNECCVECQTLHQLSGTLAGPPRVWKLSEVGAGYHKRGDGAPKVQGLHPHCRCSMATLLPGYGFNAAGMTAYIGPSHDEFMAQRGIEKSEPGWNFRVIDEDMFEDEHLWYDEAIELEDLEKMAMEKPQPGMTPHRSSAYEGGLDTVETYQVPAHEVPPGFSHEPLYHHIVKKQPYDAAKPGDHAVMHILSHRRTAFHEYPLASSASGVEDGAVTHGETAVSPSRQGQGLGTLLYSRMLRYHGKMLSDGSVSPQANGVWRKILAQPGVTGAMGAAGTPEPHQASTPTPWTERPVAHLKVHGFSVQSLEEAVESPNKKFVYDHDRFGGKTLRLHSVGDDFDHEHPAAKEAVDSTAKYREFVGEKLSKAEGDAGASGDAHLFKTGTPAEVKFTHRAQKTPDFGSRFGQDIEPSGRYVVHGHHGEPGTINEPGGHKVVVSHGVVKFHNPLVMEHGGYGPTGWKQRLSHMHDGKTGLALSHAVVASGHDGIVTIDGHHSSEIVDLTHLVGQRAGRRTKKVKPEPEPALMAVHNLSEANLHHAHELGGLAAPSIAIAHKDHPFHNFGEISLVAGEDMVDPKKTPVFDADVYSPRHPRAKHEINEKEAKKFGEWLAPHIEATGGRTYAPDYETIEKDGHEGALDRDTFKTPLRHAFLKERGISFEPVTREVQPRIQFSRQKALRDFALANGIDNHAEYGGDYHKKLSAAAHAAVYEHAAEVAAEGGWDENDKKELAEQNIGHYFTDEGLLGYNAWSHVLSDVKSEGKGEVDRYATDAKLAQHFTDPAVAAEFTSWAKAKLKPLEGKRYLPKYVDHPMQGPRLRKKPYDLANIVKEMTQTIRGGENFNYGLGTARSHGAKRFRDLDQMKKARDQIVSEEEFETKHKKPMEERWDKLVDEVRPHHNDPGGFHVLDGLAAAIGDSYKRGKYLHHELKENGFENVPTDVHQKIAQFAADLVKMPTAYFEAKLPRAVSLGEFKGAVVPHDVKPETLEMLKRHGIDHIEQYPRDDHKARWAAVNRIAEAKKLRMSEK